MGQAYSISADYHTKNVDPALINGSQMLEKLKSQLKYLSPSQLESLKGEINHQLKPECDELLSSEELDLIRTLFA
ncbi:hypothetical protein M1D72_03435 [Vibrio sp. AK197]|uniref:Uncharacterized protein n=1 Tax=Vibrio olivae TaxID=1243002 RepID=A0ABV5HRA0_9VIBR